MRDEEDDGAHSTFIHNDPVFGFLDNCTNGNGNVNINVNINGNLNPIKNVHPYGGRAPQSQSMPPLHSNPNPYTGGYTPTPCYSYSATYTAASLPTSLSHFRSAQQQSLLEMNVGHISQQNNLNLVKNHNPNLNNNLNNYSHLPIDTFAPPALALSSSHYPPQMSALVRGSSIDESGDHTDNSCSNESNNGENVIDIPNQSYFYEHKEVCMSIYLDLEYALLSISAKTNSFLSSHLLFTPLTVILSLLFFFVRYVALYKTNLVFFNFY